MTGSLIAWWRRRRTSTTTEAPGCDCPSVYHEYGVHGPRHVEAAG